MGCFGATPISLVFGSVYKWIAAFDGRQGPLWPSARLELAVICALSPLLVADLTIPWFGHTLAVDASKVGQGVVAAELPRGVVSGLAAAAGLTPADSLSSDTIFDKSLLNLLHKQTALGLSSASRLQRSMSNFVSTARWRTLVSARWRRKEHINVLESTALRTAVTWTRSHANSTNKRLLVLSDSAVVVLAHSKGRSSSKSLLFQCRRTAALLLASGLRLYVRWLPSSANPADAPSRLL